MNTGELITIKSLDDVSAKKRTPYITEIKLYSCIQQGDLAELIKRIGEIGSEIITGNMSENELMQYKYTAVSAITLATRYAVQGGVNESAAYEFSDECIKTVDKFATKEEIVMYLVKQMIALTEMVSKSKNQPRFSPYIRKSVAYINSHISEKITVRAIAGDCGVSPDYLSRIFKKETGEPVSAFIMRKKINAAKQYLIEGKSTSEIARLLGFSSASHFGRSFKRFCAISPAEYLSNVGNGSKEA